MPENRNQPVDRIFFLDNIRYLMVLLVVVFHSAAAYSEYSTWWQVNDENAALFNVILSILGSFPMPVLFFVAGYFAPPSLNSKGTWGFIRSKLKRLGVPWLLGVFLVVPYLMSLGEYAQRVDTTSYRDIFVRLLLEAFKFRSGIVANSTQFQHAHFWFLSLLLMFFIIFATLQKIGIGFKRRSEDSDRNPMIKAMLIFAILSMFIAFIIHAVLMIYGAAPDCWIIVLSVIQFQPALIALYAVCFMGGVFAYSRNWFKAGKSPGLFGLWLILSLGLFLGYHFVLSEIMVHESITLSVFFVVIRHFIAFIVLLNLTNFSLRHWNQSTIVNKTLAKNSYSIYLAHMVFVLAFQLLLLPWNASVYLKFIVTVLGSIFLSYMVSDLCLTRFPKQSAIGVILLAGVLFALL